MKPRVLFILKYRDSCTNWGDGYGQHLSSGLANSARFVMEMLISTGKVDSKLVHVCDNNGIDKEVTLYSPTHVIIEALWVVPEKFRILMKLHPQVNWIIRNHSELPFLANEGIAMEWLLNYPDWRTVYVSSNSERADRDVNQLIKAAHPEWSKERSGCKTVYLPNYYPLGEYRPVRFNKHKDVLDIACFGAIRPLKNHLTQAAAAIEFARRKKKRLRFHINGSRIEGRGDPILKNLRSLFDEIPNGELIEHPWLKHDDFIALCRTMDLGLQVSFSETFNIVAADLISQGVPVVGSPEIDWLGNHAKADPNDCDDIVQHMELVYWMKKWFRCWNPSRRNLESYNRESKARWLSALGAR